MQLPDYREYLNRLSGEILDSSIAVHKEMGPGLLESVYQVCLLKELSLRNLKALPMVPVSLSYKGFVLNKDYFIDLLVENEVIVELKATEGVLPVHEAQLISYLKLADKRVGLVMNFSVPVLAQGFRRFVNNF